MSTAYYDFRVEDEIDGLTATLADIEMDVEYEVEPDGSAIPHVEVTAIYLSGSRKIAGKGWVKAGRVDLLSSEDKFIRALGIEAKSQIEFDQGWCAERIAEDGWVYRGLGGNDPDGRFVRRVA